MPKSECFEQNCPNKPIVVEGPLEVILAWELRHHRESKTITHNCRMFKRYAGSGNTVRVGQAIYSGDNFESERFFSEAKKQMWFEGDL